MHNRAEISAAIGTPIAFGEIVAADQPFFAYFAGLGEVE